MYLEDLLNKRNIKMVILQNVNGWPVELMYSSDYKEPDNPINGYKSLQWLCKDLCNKKEIKVGYPDKFEITKVVEFEFDETKLKIKPENRIEYNLKRNI